MTVPSLIRIDTRPIDDSPEEIRVFMNERNEMRRLPGFLDHYRKIGAHRFFITDNGSTDGSKDYLLAQPDCHVFVTSESYAEAGYGVKWQNALIDQYAANRWCLLADADEWFIYPGYERKSLAEFAAYLDKTEAGGVFAFLLDMYGRGENSESPSRAEELPLDLCPYFDGEYKWYRRFRIPGITAPNFPDRNVYGGPRLRVLHPRLHRHYYLIRAFWRARDLLKLPIPENRPPPPALMKIPFVRWLPGTRFLTSHMTTPITLAKVTGVLLHFKFLDDFYARTEAEVKRKEHAYSGGEYARLLGKLGDKRSASFYYAGSIAYESSDQLVSLGLLREDEEWSRARTATGEPSRQKPAVQSRRSGMAQPADCL
jgi:glycosyltransferase involved in cell wall biosynthesis